MAPTVSTKGGMGSTIPSCMVEGKECTGLSSSPLSVCCDDPACPPLHDVYQCSPSHDYHADLPYHEAHAAPITKLDIPDLDIISINSDQVKDEDKVDSGPVYNTTTEPEPTGKGQWCCRRSKWSIWNLIGRKCKKKELRQEEKETVDGDGKDTLYWMFRKEQWFLLLLLCLTSFTSYFSLCLFPPFFPKIAQQKGCSSFILGLIIGTNCLTTFLVTPTIGKKVQTIGLKFAFCAGTFCSGGCCILAGFLEWFSPGPAFVVFSILIRMTQAIAISGVNTAAFVYIGIKFPLSVAKVFAWTRTVTNLAQMFGPVLGGAMLELGGFKLPFIVMGSIQMTVTIISVCFLPNCWDNHKRSDDKNEEIEIWKIFSIRGIWISFITFIISTMSNGFLSITLEPQVLRLFHLRSLYVGILFGLKDGANSLASPIWGLLCDRRRHVKIFILLSSCIATTSFFILGPFPGIPMKRTLLVVILAMILNGFGIGGQQVAGVVDAMQEAVGSGLPDGGATHGCVAGLWASLSGAGRFTSRLGSGYLVDIMGFQKTCTIIICLQAFVVVMTTMYLILFGDGPYSSKSDEKDQIAHRTGEIQVDGRFEALLTTTPSEPVTTKSVCISIPGCRDLENSINCGSEPLPSITRYVQANLFASQSLDCM